AAPRLRCVGADDTTDGGTLFLILTKPSVGDERYPCGLEIARMPVEFDGQARACQAALAIVWKCADLDSPDSGDP
ncbi:MAG: hypothetical protein M3Z28_11445, partial [Candidatus Dormibacteraeota bacterium]|nr:hypothetical protein [Candidatus Dormibacteraeota bacterium]